jgi:transposase
MYIAKVPNRNSPPTYLLRESYRENGKVKNRTLANLTSLATEKIEAMRRILKGEKLVSAEEAFQILRSTPHGHVAAVLGTGKRLGLDRILAGRRCRQRDLIMATIVARVLEPRSKLATARGLSEQTRSSTLGEILDLNEVDEEELYRAMDWLLERQPAIEKKLAQKHLKEGSLVLYDLSSSYYTGRCCPLAKYGHSRDGKRGFPQINYGLLCDRDGCPVATEVFEGNTSDATTVPAQIAKLRERFGLKRIVIVGDRGMLTSKQIRNELDGVEGLEWITALRSDSIRKLIESGDVDRSLFDEHDLAEITSPEFPGERLIVCRNPFLADERARKRVELLKATEKELDKIVAATRREKRRLKGQKEIALRVGKEINKRKVGKHFILTIEDDRFAYRRDEAKIAAEAALDGLYVIRTSVEADAMTAEETVATYKSLSTVERAFRSLKTVDLKVRPIYHRLADRVKAHVFLCMLAYYVEWHMRRELAPLLFDDEDHAQAEAKRKSVVAPAERSDSALAKDRTKQTSDGLPVHSFRTLLADLATLTKNRVRAAEATLDMLAAPTPIQSRAFRLLQLNS